MRSKHTVIVLLLMLLMAGSVLAGDRFDEAVTAYDRGDFATAASIFLEQAEKGDARSQHNLAMMLNFGKGVPQNYKEAIKWFSRAGEQGHVDAQYFLGRMYQHGEGVPRDAGEAAKWFRGAAEQGHARSASVLAIMYEHGEGVPQSLVNAHMWADLAAEVDVEYSKLRDLIAGKMTPDEIAEANELVREWKEQKKREDK